MAKGIDANMDCSAIAGCLVEAGYEFVARYYKFSSHAHPLTLAEAQALSNAGLFIVVVLENGFPTSPSYFSHSKGVHDGTIAYHYAMHTIGQPAGSPLYFAVDFDASLSEIAGGINDYFRGVRDGFNTISSGSPTHPIGVYGSGCTCAWLRNHTDYVTFAWLAQSTGWCGHQTFTDWNIKQGKETTVCGVQVDLDESSGHGGGFKV